MKTKITLLDKVTFDLLRGWRGVRTCNLIINFLALRIPQDEYLYNQAT